VTISGVNPTFDPDGARRAVQRAYGANLRTAGALRDYAAAMLTRFVATCPNGPYDLAILSLLRQLVAATDATLRLLEAGATYMAALPARAIMEANWSIQWALRDPERRGLLLYVTTLRHDRHMACRLLPGTPPNSAYRRAMQAAYGVDPESDPGGDPAAAQRQYDDLDRLLGRHIYREINHAFDVAQAGREHDPPWYSIGPGSVSSFAEMARELNREPDYVLFYNSLSTSVHGSNVSQHVQADETGYWIEPIVSIAGFGNPFFIATWLVFEAMMHLTKHYREGEVPTLKAKFKEWESGLSLPEIKLNPEFVRW
jgi:hypothetical protein